jgi:hypothetical protein|tara:strand:+ start:101 stop:226 length:126 start_codon:yes stop_codon:yes gene_type:complete
VLKETIENKEDMVTDLLFSFTNNPDVKINNNLAGNTAIAMI